MTPHEELFQISERLSVQASNLKNPDISDPLKALANAASAVGKSFSGSWAGYHSRVYYENFAPPPAGARFSQEWGLMETFGDAGSRGVWREYSYDAVRNHVLGLASNPNLTTAREASESAIELFNRAKADITSIIHNEIESAPDEFLKSLNDQLQPLEHIPPFEVADQMRSKRQIMTRDTIVIGQGTQIPPHIALKAEVHSIENDFVLCKELGLIARKAASHIERKAKRRSIQSRIGTNVFIGHGRSPAWRDLKDFIQDRVQLPWDEFNRVPVAGVTNISRLSEMLDAAAIAFIVMTAEDELADGKLQARMNVIHESGLFQGRLGFTKAIVMLEEGCEEFSNVSGLGQIRFPKGNIAAVFEEVRRVLEREGLIA